MTAKKRGAWALGRFLRKTWGYALLVATQVTVILLTFQHFDDLADAASVSVSVGFLLVTLVYVLETRRMASISAESLRLERSRDDRIRLAALQENLVRARTGALRAWIYFTRDKAILIDDDLDTEPPEALSPEQGFYLAARGVSVARQAHREILRNVAMLKRCGLGNEAANFIAAVPRFSAAVSMFMALGQRSARPMDRDERRAWEEECWRDEEKKKGLPPWEEVEGGRVHDDVTSAITAFSGGIDRYWAQQ